MPDAISSLPSSTAPIRHAPENDGAPDTHEISFNELWQNKKDGISFADVLDILKPLQHIPVVSTVYRMVTGDEISMVDSALYGGPFGMMGAGVVAAVEEATGKNIEGHIAYIFTDTSKSVEQVAATSNPTFEEDDDINSPGVLETPKEKAATDQLSAAPTAPASTLAATSLASASPNESLPRAQTMPSQLSQMDERKILQFLSDRKEATKQATTDAASDKKILSEAILNAQRAQTGLLLANVGATTSSSVQREAKGEPEASPKTRRDPTTPFFKPHPYLLPRGAPPALVAKTMECALERYNSLNTQMMMTPPPAPENATIR
ncbi:MAG: hypothetical protein ACPGPC_13615 [Alphaproteobacteria bacterium]